MTLYFFPNRSAVPDIVANDLKPYEGWKVKKWKDAGDEVISIFIIEDGATYVLHLPSKEQKEAIAKAVKDYVASEWWV